MINKMLKYFLNEAFHHLKFNDIIMAEDYNNII